MARAICRRSKVVLLDEATSSVDSHTDLRIQNVLRTEFKGSTIFTVAHRLDTIADYDRVLVLSAGEIVEVDNPRRLYEKKGVFWKMIQETGQADKLVGLMQEIDLPCTA
jgi:ABC-type multidrug transport system fused ATPase/permease subunit